MTQQPYPPSDPSQGGQSNYPPPIPDGSSPSEYQQPEYQQQQYQTSGYQGSAYPHPSGVSDEDRNYAVLTHLSPFPAALLVISPLGPAVAYLLSRNSRPFVRANAVEALNFNITMWIGVAISIALTPILIGFITLPFFGLMMLIFHIIGAVKAKDGEVYRYPMSWRLFT